MTWLSACILLFLVMDPFGNVPFFMCVLKAVPPERRRRVVARELLIALSFLMLFLLAGPSLLRALQISEPSLRIAGGIVLFLIALKMIFDAPENMFKGGLEGEPLIMPLAVPSLAGPSAIATVLLLTAQEPERWRAWMLAVIVAWSVTAGILLLSAGLDRILRSKGLLALHRLMGLILTTIAVEMFVQGVFATIAAHAPPL